MRLLVKYPTRVEVGDVIVGWHRPDAPTTPVQPMAAALQVAEVQTRENARGWVGALRFRWTYSPDAWSPWHTPTEGMVLVVDGPPTRAPRDQDSEFEQRILAEGR